MQLHDLTKRQIKNIFETANGCKNALVEGEDLVCLHLTVQCDRENSKHLKESQECLLCYDQSRQRSGCVNWPHNHKLIIKVLAYSLVFSHLIRFFLATK